MNGRFSNRVVVVTGAAQGIGRAVAERLRAEGALLVAIDRSALVHELRDDLSLTLTADLEQAVDCQRVLREAHAWQGRIDVLINNVGGTLWVKPFEHYRVEEIEAEIRRSLFPTLWCCHAVLPHMLARGQGAIVNVSSIATRGINRVPYGAAKGGINALTACLAFETAGRGIRVNATAPGGTQAPPRRIPRNEQVESAQDRQWYQQIVDQTCDSSLMKRYGTLDEQAGAILFLASDEASYITGTVLPVGGGDQG
ncbi:1,6-dihydroxycyclohexa-2,4-diene-1-carboxylate dehydrogenase [Pseudomonas oryzihabitans]|uniref:1,6-dihydroxycyclohexa-2,4-diene-1-carboxylate dehydrogenase n=1 Tax=Pseudomonas oryzihabitans TaxID=47885 RepID=UPI002893C438|nr:1,6-dihydroxycyclohexa-2,4-diene-1-carboxylate dehydrogenase [Pseudomonas oryzihabitans]MDT3722222.1 1,6-dihydroxycyclohexa-2,4-diene-1-carboxylate dehydrogenase [Pseudomonas oryzihabitans]